VTVRDAGPLLIFFVLGLTAAISTVWLERAHVGAVGPDFEIPLLQRTLMAGRAVWFYLGKLLWPHPLMFTYPKWNIDSADLVAYVYLLGAVALVISLWRLRKRIGAGPLVATLYFGGTLLPALGFFNLYPLRYSPVADHFQYLASIGPITLIAALAVRATRTLPLSWRGAAAAGVLAVLAILTWRQCGTYSDEETLWKRTLDRNPTAWIAHNNLGAICAARDEVDAAVGHFTKAVTLNPHAPEIRNNFGMFLLKRGQVAEAEEHVRQAIRLDTRRDDAQSNLGVILLNQGKLEAAADQFARALRLNPYNVSARFNLGCTLSALGRWDEAIAHLQEAARLDPADVETREHLARALEQKARSAGGTRTP
jgi:Flp pilus assembly protein TadD